MKALRLAMAGPFEGAMVGLGKLINSILRICINNEDDCTGPFPAVNHPIKDFPKSRCGNELRNVLEPDNVSARKFSVVVLWVLN